MPRHGLLYLLITALALCACPAAAQTGRTADLNYNLIDFSVQASRDVANDLMQATLYAEAVGNDPGELAAVVNKRLVEAVKQAKAVAGIKVESGNYQTQPNYQKGRREGWRTRADLQLESTDFQALAKLIGRLQGADMLLGDMRFCVSPALRTGIEAELTKDALDAFKARAELVKKSLNAPAYKIVTIHLDSQSPQARRVQFRAMAMAAAEEPAPPAAEAGSSQIIVSASGTVQVQ